MSFCAFFVPFFIPFFLHFNHSNSASKKTKRRTQRKVNKTEKVSEHINFSNRGASRFHFNDLMKFQKFIAFFKDLRAVFSDRFVTGSADHEIVLPEYFQSTIRHAAHFQREVNMSYLTVPWWVQGLIFSLNISLLA